MYEVLKYLEAIKISGTNCKNFLQNLTTNNVKDKLFSYNYFLDRKGRYLFDGFVYQVPGTKIESYIILSHPQHIKDLISHLNFFKLRENIQIDDISQKYKILYSTKAISDKNIIFSIQDPRYKDLGYISMIFEDNLELLEIPSANDIYLKDKYQFAIIDGATELISKKSVILEYAALELNAIDKNKGCYLGQELISRVVNQGVVRKKIYKVVSDALIAKSMLHDDLLIQDRKIGHICSIYKNFAIALINIDKIPYEDKKSFILTHSNLNFVLEQPKWY